MKPSNEVAAEEFLENFNYGPIALFPEDEFSKKMHDRDKQIFLAGCKFAEPRWISVKERLPEFKQDCLAVDIYGLIETVQRIEADRLPPWIYQAGCDCCQRIDLRNITHWMTLTPPPTEEK